MMTKKNNKIAHQQLKLPKGGGAIKGMGESFRPNLFNGTAGLSIPIPITPARGLEPSLDIAYNSGSGNGVFGLGFHLGIGQITRKTNRTIPQYTDKDTFVIEEAEELVPTLIKNNNDWQPDEFQLTKENILFKIKRFRPRTESTFSRIEQWTNTASNTIHWETTSADGTLSIYGKNLSAKIVSPTNENKVFSWLLESVIDSHGNKIHYQYKAENTENIRWEIYEKNRSHTTNKYLKSVEYGNYKDETGNEQFAFKVLFDYGEHTDPIKPHLEKQSWNQRHDPFSSYHAGFEIRTHRLCQRVMVFHQFKELGETEQLVKSVHFSYSNKQVFTQLEKVTTKGHLRKFNKYITKETPPLEFGYTQFEPEKQKYQTLSLDLAQPLSQQINSEGFLWTDLYGEGLSGILQTTENSAWFYENQGNGTLNNPKKLNQFPIEKELTNPQYSLQSLEGNGLMDFVVQAENRSGYYEMNREGQWNPFQSFETRVTPSSNDLQYADFNGDGRGDLVQLESQQISWYPSNGKKGVGAPVMLHQEVMLKERSTTAQFRVQFLDVFGDGMSHQVKIGNNTFECRPHLGYGQFGNLIQLGNAPFFEEDFKQERLHLVDIDGNGLSDLVYVYEDYVKIWFNLSGNRFSSPLRMELPTIANQLTSLQFADIKGNGTTAMLVAYKNQQTEKIQHKYIDFSNGVKPYLMNQSVNNMGATTRIQYSPSTKFFLADKKKGTPWSTHLPFPVNVVEKTESIDHISGAKMVTSYSYHHGYYDSVENEFRGFGRVEQWDTEAFEQFEQTNLINDIPFEIGEKGHHIPPVHTKSWFHTGAYEEEQKLSRQFEQEYYQEDKLAHYLPDSVIDIYSSIEASSRREAHRALRGTLLRTEVYSDDNKENLSTHPYTVSEANYRVQLIQPKANNLYPVFLTHQHESMSYHYERNPKDPRISHTLSLETDEYGHELKSCEIVYPRRKQIGTYPEQEMLKATFTLNSVLNQTTPHYRLGTVFETKTFEIGGLKPSSNYFDFSELKKKIEFAQLPENLLRYDEKLNETNLRSRLLDWQRLYFWDEQQTKALPLGQITSKLLVHHVENAEAPLELYKKVYRQYLTPDDIKDKGKYFINEGYWWNPGLIQHYNKNKGFFLPTHTEDPWGNQHKVTYDPYYFAAIKVEDPLQNKVKSFLDYRVMQQWKQIDINENIAELAFDPLGMVFTTTIYGTENDKKKGDLPIANYTTTTPANMVDIIANPHQYLQGSTNFYYYDLFAWKERKEPSVAISLQRETHRSELSEGQETKVQFQLEYSDGLGRSIQKKIKVEKGKAYLRNADGSLKLDENGKPIKGEVNQRWLSNGRVVNNNKGKPIKQYEPFYSSTWRYEQEREITDLGISPIMHYDPLGRVVRTDTPKGFFSKVTFTPWEQKSYDANDTILDSDYYKRNINSLQEGELDALKKAAKHYDTPIIETLDSLGRTFQTTAKLEDGTTQTTKVELDIEGKQLTITDPRQLELNKTRAAEKQIHNFIYTYDMSGDIILSQSMDAGAEIVFNDVLGKPKVSWETRGYLTTISYDKLHRPVSKHIKGNGLNQFTEKLEYGDLLPDAEKKNLRGEIVKHYHQAGLDRIEAFDFKGKPLAEKQQVRQEYKKEVNWNAPTSEKLHSSVTTNSEINAVGKLLWQKLPDGSIHRPIFNTSGQLKQIKVSYPENLQQETLVVKNIEYNDKGQRKYIEYGNGVLTSYQYEPLTYELKNLKSYRKSDNKILQQIDYYYDPNGNITRIQDHTHKTVFHNQQQVNPICDYTYDALYQLKIATGREHPALSKKSYQKDFKQSGFIKLNDQQALRSFIEKYSYDEAGNMIKMQHKANQNSWTRDITVAKESNRAILTEQLGSRTLNSFFDANGNLKELEHLRNITWNYRDQIASVVLVERPDGKNDSEYYIYDDEGNRVRKVLETYNNEGDVLEINEKVYLGGVEIKRIKKITFSGSKTELKRVSTHIMDDNTRIGISHYWKVDEKQREIEQPATRKTHYQLENHLGSSSLELSDKGEIISYEEYFPYGGTAFSAGANQKEVKIKEYRYSGKERDDSTGLYYYGQRYYAPWMVRWLNPDPIGKEGGLNLYEFVESNPINLTDPNGENGLPVSSRGWLNNYSSGLNYDADATRLSVQESLAGVSKAKKSFELPFLLGPFPFFGFGFLSPSILTSSPISVPSRNQHPQLKKATGRALPIDYYQNKFTSQLGMLQANPFGAMGYIGARILSNNPEHHDRALATFSAFGNIVMSLGIRNSNITGKNEKPNLTNLVLIPLSGRPSGKNTKMGINIAPWYKKVNDGGKDSDINCFYCSFGGLMNMTSTQIANKLRRNQAGLQVKFAMTIIPQYAQRLGLVAKPLTFNGKIIEKYDGYQHAKNMMLREAVGTFFVFGFKIKNGTPHVITAERGAKGIIWRDFQVSRGFRRLGADPGKHFDSTFSPIVYKITNK